jgi:predicted anti-sigma-YlaC factor YlaD
MASELTNLQRGCTRAREWVSLRADGELSELERLLLRRHLGRCEACRTFAETVGEVTEVLRTTPQELPSRTLEPAQPRIRERRRLRLRVAAAATALAAAGAVAGVLIASEGGKSSPVQPPAGTTIVQLPDAPPPIPSRPPAGANV